MSKGVLNLAIVFLAFGAGLWLAQPLRKQAQQHFPQCITADDGEYEIKRIGGYQYVRPILYSEPVHESPLLAPLKRNISEALQKMNIGDTEVSVYFKEFGKGRWTCLNPELRFRPASLLKMALILDYLRQAQSDPSVLDRLMSLSPRDTAGQNYQFFSDQVVRLGERYTVRELLELMAEHSDNNASRLLASGLSPESQKQLFETLGLPPINFRRGEYLLTARETSAFLKSIFNGAILRPELSDYAASLLSKGRFSEGFAAAFPRGIPAWYKYGEWHDGRGVHELHETAVFFVGDQAYLLTVMTRGRDPRQLAEILRAVARVIMAETGA